MNKVLVVLARVLALCLAMVTPVLAQGSPESAPPDQVVDDVLFDEALFGIETDKENSGKSGMFPPGQDELPAGPPF